MDPVTTSDNSNNDSNNVKNSRTSPSFASLAIAAPSLLLPPSGSHDTALASALASSRNLGNQPYFTPSIYSLIVPFNAVLQPTPSLHPFNKSP